MAKELSQEYGKEVLKTGASLLVRGTLSETPEGLTSTPQPPHAARATNACS